MGWRRWVSDEGDMIAVETYGASAPAEIIFEKYGFTTDNIVQRGLALLGRRGPVSRPGSVNGQLANWDEFDNALHERELEKVTTTQTEMETPAEKQS